MRVTINTGCYHEEEKQLAKVVEVSDYYLDFDNVRQLARYAQEVAAQNAALIELLVEKGVITLADCTSSLGAPRMEAVEDLL